MTMKPFVKWAGGKTQLLDELVSRMPEYTGTYYEPFVGGGALFLHQMPANAVLGDVNEDLLNVYVQLKLDVYAVLGVLDLLDASACTQDLYESRRLYFNEHRGESTVEQASLFIWLNKYCFNGLYRVNKSGQFNVPWNKKGSVNLYDEDNMIQVHDYLNSSHVEFVLGDFEELCDRCVSGDFVYFDSPYVPAGITANFVSYTGDGFGACDHYRLRDLFDRLTRNGVKCMLSNNDVPDVREMYKNYRIDSISVKRNINSKGSNRRGQEVIIMNY